DTLDGGGGNDILNGTDATARGYLEKDILIGGAGADIFVLGDAKGAYYGLDGVADFATIKDFVIGIDILQLHGSAASYQQSRVNSDLLVYYGVNQDLIAKFEGLNSLDLYNSSIASFA
ncbi:hemolysin, partial [filamentous cyanobacterium CCP5]